MGSVFYQCNSRPKYRIPPGAKVTINGEQKARYPALH
jgi:hypothetical protein